jgi:hypothetical protein
MDKKTQRLYMLVAGARNYEDVINLLQLLSDDAADVRVDIPFIGEADSLVVRKAIYNYLKAAIDNLRKIKNNGASSSSVGDD